LSRGVVILIGHQETDDASPYCNDRRHEEHVSNLPAQVLRHKSREDKTSKGIEHQTVPDGKGDCEKSC
jgi:hypothetical protein